MPRSSRTVTLLLLVLIPVGLATTLRAPARSGPIDERGRVVVDGPPPVVVEPEPAELEALLEAARSDPELGPRWALRLSALVAAPLAQSDLDRLEEFLALPEAHPELLGVAAEALARNRGPVAGEWVRERNEAQACADPVPTALPVPRWREPPRSRPPHPPPPY